MSKSKKKQSQVQPESTQDLKDGEADWDSQCMNCDQSPTVHPTGLCGPCCFGEADTANGNW